MSKTLWMLVCSAETRRLREISESRVQCWHEIAVTAWPCRRRRLTGRNPRGVVHFHSQDALSQQTGSSGHHSSYWATPVYPTGYLIQWELFVLKHSSTQHGYRSNHSTEKAFKAIANQIFQAMNNGQIAMPAIIDLSQCLDISYDPLPDKFQM